MSTFRLTSLTVVLTLFLAGTLMAQPLTLTIKDQAVFVNGKQLPPDAYPESLAVEGQNVKYYFEGIESPTFRVDGRYFLVEENRIIAIPPPGDEAANTTVIFRQRSAATPPSASKEADDAVYEFEESTGSRYIVNQSDPVTTVMHQYVTEIGAQAEQLQGMREVASNRDAAQILNQLMMQAQEAQEIAANMADLQFQQYLSMVQSQDRVLYDRLVREYNLEKETWLLAQRARQMEDSDERDQVLVELEGMLNEIFELKQQNRREEIKQLEMQLEILQEKLQQREDMRQDIVKRRLNELVGQ